MLSPPNSPLLPAEAGDIGIVVFLAEGITGYHRGIGKASALCRLPPHRGAAMAAAAPPLTTGGGMAPAPLRDLLAPLGPEEPCSCVSGKTEGNRLPASRLTPDPSQHPGEAKGITPCGEVKPLGKIQHSEAFPPRNPQTTSHGVIWSGAVWGRRWEWAVSRCSVPQSS